MRIISHVCCVWGNFTLFSEIYVPVAKILCIASVVAFNTDMLALRGFFSCLTKDIELNQACARRGMPIAFGVQTEVKIS